MSNLHYITSTLVNLLCFPKINRYIESIMGTPRMHAQTPSSNQSRHFGIQGALDLYLKTIPIAREIHNAKQPPTSIPKGAIWRIQQRTYTVQIATSSQQNPDA